jgi:hypothetical protein
VTGGAGNGPDGFAPNYQYVMPILHPIQKPTPMDENDNDFALTFVSSWMYADGMDQVRDWTGLSDDEAVGYAAALRAAGIDLPAAPAGVRQYLVESDA